MKKVRVGVIGGSGFYSLMEKAKEIKVETPYGLTSGKVCLGKISGQEVAFLARHNPSHDLPPHKIPYQANIYALKSLGVERIITVTAAGSLQPDIHPGDFVVLDQFVDRTKNQEDTFFHGPITTHVSAAYPYCPQLRRLAFNCGQGLQIKIHPQGTVVVIQGPRFSTRAESEWFTKMGWQVVNMTQYPEVILAREMELCYSAVALITDYDVGLVAEKKVKPVSVEDFSRVFRENNEKALKLVYEMIKKMPVRRTCRCGRALKGARVE